LRSPERRLGRLRLLILPLNEHCHGRGGWRVAAEEQEWREIVAAGLKEGLIAF
jgi:hypothetical protein